MEEFHLVEEVANVAQLHIEQIRKLEEREARSLLRRYKEIRQELRDRLDTLPRDKFTAQQVRGTMLQIDLAIKAMEKSLKEGMSSAAFTVAEEGIGQLTEELNRWNKKFTGAVVPINLNAAVAANDTNNFLFNRYDSSIEAYSGAVRSKIAGAIADAAIEQIGVGELTQRLGQFFMGEEWKLQQIARTELHNVYNVGKMRGMGDIKESTMPDMKKTLMHPMDARTGEDSKHAARLNLIVDIDEPFVYKWKGETRRFMAPPDRPNDRSILIPYREEWGNVGGAYLPEKRKRVEEWGILPPKG